MPSPNKPRRSILRSGPDYVSQVIEIEIGGDIYKFDARELSATAQVAIDDWPKETADALGTTEDVLKDEKQLIEFFREHGDEPYDDEAANTKEKYFLKCLEAQWDIAILDAISAWDLSEPLSETNKLLLPKTVKRVLFRAISNGSTVGVGAASFFQ